MTDVFLLWHVHGIECDEPELIGVYSLSDKATEAAKRLSDQPGFREQRDLLDDPDPTEGGFQISRYRLDEDNWSEGHVLAD